MNRKRVMVAGLVLAAVSAVAAFILLREPLETLTPARLAAARQRWEAAGIADYDVVYQMAGDTYDVRVRGGHVSTLMLNGRHTTTSRPQDYGVEGLFHILELELDVLLAPDNPFGGDPSTTLLRVRFHPELGYCERYLRVIGGSGRSHGIRMLQFHVR